MDRKSETGSAPVVLTPDVIGQLRMLQKLRGQGVISEAEYTKQRAALTGELPAENETPDEADGAAARQTEQPPERTGGGDCAEAVRLLNEAIRILKRLDAQSGGALLEKYPLEARPAAASSRAQNQAPTLKVGDYCVFGSYPQSPEGLPEPIEWLVLAKEGTRLLLLSRYGLDCKQYHPSYTDVPWETCAVRGWLNDQFLRTAFREDEQSRIVPIVPRAAQDPGKIASDGSGTADRVFLLSVEEARAYFPTDESRACGATDYAVSKGAQVGELYQADGRAACWWWLRSPGGNACSAATVSRVGDLSLHGYGVYRANGAVRPAIWVETDS